MKNLIYKIRNFTMTPKQEFHPKITRSKEPVELFTERDLFGLEKTKGSLPVKGIKPYRFFIAIGIIFLIVLAVYVVTALI